MSEGGGVDYYYYYYIVHIYEFMVRRYCPSRLMVLSIVLCICVIILLLLLLTTIICINMYLVQRRWDRS